MIMKANLYDIQGKVKKEVDLPKVFDEPVREDLINRAFHAVQTQSLQKKGNYPRAGVNTSAVYVGRRRKYRSGITRGISRLPRVKLSGGRLGEVRRVPQSRGGHRAHPPKVEHIIIEQINQKENRKAIASAIAATSKIELVKGRGHKIGKIKSLPLIVEDACESIKKTKEAVEMLTKLGIGEDLERASKKKVKAGKGQTRGRKYKKKTSALIVVSDKAAFKAFRNIEGIDVELAGSLNALLLAPGGNPGRLTIYSESALKKIGDKYVI